MFILTASSYPAQSRLQNTGKEFSKEFLHFPLPLCKIRANIFTEGGRRRKINRGGNVIGGGMKNMASLLLCTVKALRGFKGQK